MTITGEHLAIVGAFVSLLAAIVTAAWSVRGMVAGLERRLSDAIAPIQVAIARMDERLVHVEDRPMHVEGPVTDRRRATTELP